MRNWIVVVLGIGVWLWCSCSPELTLVSPGDSVIEKDIDAGSDGPDGLGEEEVDVDSGPDVSEIDSTDNEICAPNCVGKECGSDGCDGFCGAGCDEKETCQEGICVVNCDAVCDDAECGEVDYGQDDTCDCGGCDEGDEGCTENTCVKCPEEMVSDGNVPCSMPVCGAPGVCDLCSAPDPLAGKGLNITEIRLLTDSEELVEMDLAEISEPENFLGNALGEINLMDALLLHLVNGVMKPFLFSPGYAGQCTEEAFDLYLLPSKLTDENQWTSHPAFFSLADGDLGTRLGTVQFSEPFGGANEAISVNEQSVVVPVPLQSGQVWPLKLSNLQFDLRFSYSTLMICGGPIDWEENRYDLDGDESQEFEPFHESNDHLIFGEQLYELEKDEIEIDPLPPNEFRGVVTGEVETDSLRNLLLALDAGADLNTGATLWGLIDEADKKVTAGGSDDMWLTFALVIVGNSGGTTIYCPSSD